MKISWVHSFPPSRQHSGVFMHELREPLRERGYETALTYIGDIRSPYGLARAIRLARIKAAEADLTHAQYGSGCGFVSSFVRSPKVLTLRGSDWYGAGGPARGRHLRASLAPLLSRLALRRFDHVCVPSERMSAEVSRFSPDVDLSTIPSAIDLERFVPQDRMEARRAIGVKGDDTPWVLFSTVSLDNRVKRPWLARAAMEIVNETSPNAKLKIMHGIKREEVPTFVAACDLILLTSTHEGWPNIVKEGLACNIPFVSTDVSDLRDIAETEPSCAIAEAEPKALAAAILSRLESHVSGSLRKHVEGMSLPATLTKIGDLYDRLVPAR